MLLSTRSHGQVTVKYPILDQFNYSVVHVVVDGHEYLLDGTDPDLPFGVLPLHCINGYGLVVDKKEERWVALESGENFHTETFVLASYDSASHGLLANVSQKEKGYAALNVRKAYRAKKEEVPGFTAQNFTIKHLDEPNEAVLISFDTPYPATPAGDLVYINPFHYSPLDENPFKATQRQHPI